MYFLHEAGNNFNGASRSALSLIKANSAMGNYSYVILPEQDGVIGEKLKEMPNVEIIAARFYRWKYYKSNSKIKWLLKCLHFRLFESVENNRTAKVISKFAIENNVELLHSNSSVINIGALVSKYTGIPHIWHIREFGEEDFNMYPLVSYGKYYEEVNRYSSKIICISQAISNKIAKKIKPDKVKLIYNGVDISYYSISLKKHSGVNILITGHISRKKGQWIAVEAVQHLVKMGIKDVHLYIAGEGTVDDLKIYPGLNSSYITMLGFVEDMKSVRESMDIELMCSVSEGFGRTTVEAMAAGLIVVGANGGATPELIEENVNGFLFRVNDSLDLAYKIKKVINMCEDDKMRIREEAFRRVKRLFSEEQYIDEVFKIYQEILR